MPIARPTQQFLFLFVVCGSLLPLAACRHRPEPLAAGNGCRHEEIATSVVRSLDAEPQKPRLAEIRALHGQWSLIKKDLIDPAKMVPPEDPYGPGVAERLVITVPQSNENSNLVQASSPGYRLLVEILAPDLEGGYYRIEVPDASITNSTLRVGPWPGPVLVFEYVLEEKHDGLHLQLQSNAYNLRMIFQKTSNDPRLPEVPKKAQRNRF